VRQSIQQILGKTRKHVKITIHLEITIAAPRPRIFAVLTDLPSYSTWLPQSSTFKGTTEVSSTPVQLGTRYLKPGP